MPIEIKTGPVTEPGFYRLPVDDYHADPAPEPSLSSSVAQVLIDRSPLHAWTAHPRLNPDYEHEDNDRADLGSIAHKLLLHHGAEIRVIDAKDWRTNDAKKQRDEAREAGLLPCLKDRYDLAKKMEKAARQLFASAFPDEFHTEVVMIWREGNAWCRSMIDAISADGRTIVDYKTTGDASPSVFGRRLYDSGYHRQRAFYERGLAALDPDGRGRRHFYFLAQEIDPPFACSVHEVDAAGSMIAAKQVAWAIGAWEACLKAGKWPGYEGVNKPELPPWLEKSWLEREMTMEFHRPIDPIF
jgi:hypothetical protein